MIVLNILGYFRRNKQNSYAALNNWYHNHNLDLSMRVSQARSKTYVKFKCYHFTRDKFSHFLEVFSKYEGDKRISDQAKNK